MGSKRVQGVGPKGVQGLKRLDGERSIGLGFRVLGMKPTTRSLTR